MMRSFMLMIGCWIFIGQSLAAEVPVIVYHDIRDVAGSDEYVVTSRMFREQMEFLKQQGYQPVSLARFADAASGKSGLPERPIVISFDDGLASFRDIAMPVLEEYGFPAVLAVVTGWLDGRQVPVGYRGRLLTWEQLRAIGRSSLVEILSHTDDLHHGVPANPQGNQTPASITRVYDAAGRRYETEADFRARIRADLAHSVQRLRTELGKNPPGIVWPYGFFDQVLAEEAAALGMRYQLTLDNEPASTGQFPRINRVVLRSVTTIAAFESTLRFERTRLPRRIVEIELDDMAISPAADQEKWLSGLLNRLQLLRANTVVVNPFTRDGRHAFFQNGYIPMQAEVLHRVLHQVRSRAGIDYLLLRIPAIPAVVRAATELARRHPYDQILLAADHQRGDAAALQKLFEYHHPGVRCGQEPGTEWSECRDFMVVLMDSPKAASKLVVSNEVSTPTYYLLQNRPDEDGVQVAGALRRLRAAGYRHYGLRYGTFLDNPQTMQRVAAELAGHAVRGSSN